MVEVPTFQDFYAAVHGGRRPFPWQARLADQVAELGAWPAEIGVPTGLGKTSCLDIAVWALAVDSIRPPGERRAPTRIWWVVNRRLLVDNTAEHAEELACGLHESLGSSAADPALRRVAELLAERSTTGRPLDVVRLRGGAAAGRPADPAQPAILLSTIPMYGSRLLFGGYGLSYSMRPIDAALAGTDSILLVDEAHLARHLIDLLPPLADCDPATNPFLPPQRRQPAGVALTATGDVDTNDRFDLDADDLANPVVRQRVDATKPTQLRQPSGKPGPALAEAAFELLSGSDSARTCVVFANTPATARATYEQLVKRLGRRSAAVDADVELLTGRMREREAADVRSRVMESAGTGVGPPEKHLIVVATQTLEVGADLDFDYLVTEPCGVRALTQRMGRLNRLGAKPWAKAIYCHLPGKRDGWPVYGSEPAEVFERLEDGSGDGQPIDLGPAKIGAILGPPADVDAPAPAVLPALLWEWVKTTTPPPGAAPVEPYFSGLQPRDRAVTVAWRAFVPSDGEAIWPRVTTDETIDVPISEARSALDGLPLARLGPDRLTVECVDVGDLRPGDVVVLPSSAGYYDDFGWNPGAVEAQVLDVSVLRSGLPVEDRALQRLFGAAAPSADLVARVVDPDPDCDDAEVSEAEGELLATIQAASVVGSTETEWAELRRLLGRHVVRPVGEVPRIPLREASIVEARADAFDENSLATVTDLRTHGEGVARMARQIADAIGLPEDLASAVEAAARFHDVGKADPRFQQWLDPDGTTQDPVAKSDPRHRSRWRANRVAAGWPAGGRHEELSRRLVEEWVGRVDPSHGELICHLVVSHHGHGRPFLIPADDGTGGSVSTELDGQEFSVAADLSVADWCQPARFRSLCEQHGYWGVALLEAIVRQADHRVSAGEAVDWEVL